MLDVQILVLLMRYVVAIQGMNNIKNERFIEPIASIYLVELVNMQVSTSSND
jgi:hypothetical protein